MTTDKKCKVNLVRRKMGMVFQSFNLFAHKTIIENIMMGQVDLLGRSRQEAYDRGMELLRTIGLGDKALAYPDELSGGQKQRAAIARTRRLIQRSRVDFPVPDGPIMEITSPFLISTLTSCKGV